MSTASTEWSLSAPESWLLRYGPVSRIGAEPFKLCIQDLLSRRALRIVSVQIPLALRLRRPSRCAIAAGSAFETCAEPALEPLLDLLATVPQRRLLSAARAWELDGVLIEDFLRAARKAFGGYAGYAHRHVAPALEDRGLLEIQSRTAARPAYSYTPAGRLADEKLDRLLVAGGCCPGTTADEGLMLLGPIDPGVATGLDVALGTFDLGGMACGGDGGGG